MKKNLSLSICMIVKNEEKYIDSCLKSMSPLIENGIAELVIVDTGSTDKTIDICRKYTESIYDFEWQDNFSMARNYSISKANGEYIFIQDADQCVDTNSINDLINLFKSKEYRNYNTIYIKLRNYLNENLKEYSDLKFPLIFKNDGNFKYIGAIHNQPIFTDPIKFTDIQINHFGYIMDDTKMLAKFNRTATILKKELSKNPSNYYYMFQLAKSYNSIGNFEDSKYQVDRYLKLISKKIDEESLMYYRTAAQTYYLNNEFIKTIDICNDVLKVFPYFLDCIYLEGLSLNKIKKYDKSIELLNRYLNILDNKLYIDDISVEMFSLSSKENAIKVIEENKKIIEFNNWIIKLKENLKVLLESNIEEAINILNELRNMPEYKYITDAEFFTITSAIYFLSTDYNKALEEVNYGFIINVNNSDLIYNKACILEMLGDKVGAIFNYKLSRNQYVEEDILAVIDRKILELQTK